MIGWVINALFLWCFGMHGTAVGVVASVGVAIQVTGLSDLVGGSMGALCVAATGVAVGVAVVSSN